MAKGKNEQGRQTTARRRTVLRPSRKAAGLQGENRMRHLLDDRLEEPTYVVMHDVIIPGLYGMPTQIDHLVISTYGVFVVEMKNWKGDLEARATRWLQRKGPREQMLKNPIRQNAQHVKTIATRLNIPEDLIHNLVAVPPQARFSGGRPEGVYFFEQVPEAIRSHATPVIKPEQVPEIASAVREWIKAVPVEDRRNFTQILKRRFRETT